MANYQNLHLDPDEHVILEVRKHWIVFVGYALSLLLAALLPFALFAAAKIFLPQFFAAVKIPDNFNLPALVLFFYSLWLLFLWASFFLQWTRYYLDVWFVTEKRIIDVNQKNIFNREISNLRFDKIQDITVDVRGFVSTLLGFGNIKVETAGEDNMDFVMNTVRRPDEVRRVIFSQHNEIGDTPLSHARANTPAK
jgi:uncharacterized membrane protein YdbT with pleckstrin-like domain